MHIIDNRFESRYGNGNRRPRRVGLCRSLGGVFIVLLTLLSLTACQGRDLGSQIPTASPVSLSTLDSTPTHTATPAPSACYQQPGQIFEETLTSSLIPRRLEIRIYLPPCYEDDRAEPYPALYLFHGLGDDYDQWPRLGLIELADEWLMNQRVEPFLIVMPRELSGQDMAAAVLEVLIPHMESYYHVRMDHEGRAMGGISRGGGWALAVAANDPGVFGAIGLHSTGVLNSMDYLQLKLQQPWSAAQPRLWIDVGERDSLRARALELLDLFDRLGLEYTWHLNPGAHSDEYWSNHIEDYLDWYLQGWE